MRGDVFVGCEQFFRPGYAANLVPSRIPALDGVEAKLRAGAKVADISCGLGAAQAGEAALRQLAIDAGFARFRRAAETPFNIVLEARP